jgi:putative addiction module component (TIGR02574 family)
MSNAARKLLPSLLTLSRTDKEFLAQQLIDSIQEDHEDSMLVVELNRRMEELRSGKVQPIPSEEVHRKLREKYG